MLGAGTGYRFSEFSGWISIFRAGSGTITLSDHATKAKLFSTKIPLTPGPLVVVVKDSCPDRGAPTSKCGAVWPPNKPTAVETIAASFVPPKTGSAVRLFNLAADVPVAGLRDGGSTGKSLAQGVKYSLGSPWAPVDATQQTFTAVGGAGALASAPFTPPAAPQVFTTFLLGSKAFGYSLLPQVDAPETGPCKPPAAAAALAREE